MFPTDVIAGGLNGEIDLRYPLSNETRDNVLNGKEGKTTAHHTEILKFALFMRLQALTGVQFTEACLHSMLTQGTSAWDNVNSPASNVDSTTAPATSTSASTYSVVPGPLRPDDVLDVAPRAKTIDFDADIYSCLQALAAADVSYSSSSSSSSSPSPASSSSRSHYASTPSSTHHSRDSEFSPRALGLPASLSRSDMVMEIYYRRLVAVLGKSDPEAIRTAFKLGLSAVQQLASSSSSSASTTATSGFQRNGSLFFSNIEGALSTCVDAAVTCQRLMGAYHPMTVHGLVSIGEMYLHCVLAQGASVSTDDNATHSSSSTSGERGRLGGFGGDDGDGDAFGSVAFTAAATYLQKGLQLSRRLLGIHPVQGKLCAFLGRLLLLKASRLHQQQAKQQALILKQQSGPTGGHYSTPTGAASAITHYQRRPSGSQDGAVAGARGSGSAPASNGSAQSMSISFGDVADMQSVSAEVNALRLKAAAFLNKAHSIFASFFGVDVATSLGPMVTMSQAQSTASALINMAMSLKPLVVLTRRAHAAAEARFREVMASAAGGRGDGSSNNGLLDGDAPGGPSSRGSDMDASALMNKNRGGDADDGGTGDDDSLFFSSLFGRSSDASSADQLTDSSSSSSSSASSLPVDRKPSWWNDLHTPRLLSYGSSLDEETKAVVAVGQVPASPSALQAAREHLDVMTDRRRRVATLYYRLQHALSIIEDMEGRRRNYYAGTLLDIDEEDDGIKGSRATSAASTASPSSLSSSSSPSFESDSSADGGARQSARAGVPVPYPLQRPGSWIFGPCLRQNIPRNVVTTITTTTTTTSSTTSSASASSLSSGESVSQASYVAATSSAVGQYDAKSSSERVPSSSPEISAYRAAAASSIRAVTVAAVTTRFYVWSCTTPVVRIICNHSDPIAALPGQGAGSSAGAATHTPVVFLPFLTVEDPWAVDPLNAEDLLGHDRTKSLSTSTSSSLDNTPRLYQVLFQPVAAGLHLIRVHYTPPKVDNKSDQPEPSSSLSSSAAGHFSGPVLLTIPLRTMSMGLPMAAASLVEPQQAQSKIPQGTPFAVALKLVDLCGNALGRWRRPLPSLSSSDLVPYSTLENETRQAVQSMLKPTSPTFLKHYDMRDFSFAFPTFTSNRGRQIDVYHNPSGLLCCSMTSNVCISAFTSLVCIDCK